MKDGLLCQHFPPLLSMFVIKSNPQACKVDEISNNIMKFLKTILCFVTVKISKPSNKHCIQWVNGLTWSTFAFGIISPCVQMSPVYVHIHLYCQCVVFCTQNHYRRRKSVHITESRKKFHRSAKLFTHYANYERERPTLVHFSNFRRGFARNFANFYSESKTRNLECHSFALTEFNYCFVSIMLWGILNLGTDERLCYPKKVWSGQSSRVWFWDEL